MSNLIAPANLALTQLNIARKPQSGGDLIVNLSRLPVIEAAQFEPTSAASGTLTVDSGYAEQLADRPSSLGLIVVGAPIDASDEAGAPSLTLAVTFADDTTGTATVSLAYPTWLGEPAADRNYPIGHAKEFTPSAAKLVKSIQAFTAASNWPVGVQVLIAGMPALTSFTEVGCTTGEDFTTKENSSRGVACRYDGSRFTKTARSEPGSLAVKAKTFSQAQGLNKFRGQNCTALIMVKKDNAVVTEHLFFSEYRPTTPVSAGEGDDDVMSSASGIYQRFAAFKSPAAE